MFLLFLLASSSRCVKFQSDASTTFCPCEPSPSSPSSNADSSPGSVDGEREDREWDLDREKDGDLDSERKKDGDLLLPPILDAARSSSSSAPAGAGLFPRFINFRLGVFTVTTSSCMLDTVVAVVAVELLRPLIIMLLASVVAVVLDATVARDVRLVVDFERERRYEPLSVPPKMSPRRVTDPAAPKRLRESASSPNMGARERTLAVGVLGIEFLPVRNLNNPYW